MPEALDLRMPPRESTITAKRGAGVVQSSPGTYDEPTRGHGSYRIRVEAQQATTAGLAAAGRDPGKENDGV